MIWPNKYHWQGDIFSATARYQLIERMAYATDIGPADQHAVEQLMEFASVLGAQLHFVHVETTPDIGSMEDRVEIEITLSIKWNVGR